MLYYFDFINEKETSYRNNRISRFSALMIQLIVRLNMENRAKLKIVNVNGILIINI